MIFNMLLASIFTIVQLNCENLFDCKDDLLKADEEFLPDSYKHWTERRYWQKLNAIGQEVIACGENEEGWKLPDLVGLCEVENDSVIRDLTKRSLLRQARYEYVMTDSPDERGVDVALLYSPFTFSLLQYHSLRVKTIAGMRPTRDILYAKGRMRDGDILHVFVIHAPSKAEGEAQTRPYRMQVALRLGEAIDSIRQHELDARIVMMGDFNDTGNALALRYLKEKRMMDISEKAVGRHGAKGTYRYRGEWGSLDHIFVSESIVGKEIDCYVYDADFLLEADEIYGGKRPRRSYRGAKYLGGYSDHLPLVARIKW